MNDQATPPAKPSDLGVRTISAIVMVAVAGFALWMSGWYWASFVSAVAIAVLWEWWDIVRKFSLSLLGQLAWIVGGLFYVGVGASTLMQMNLHPSGIWQTLVIVGAVIATDVGAYFAGRSIGGPKIAPKISPSKTWAGLFGGIVAASIWFFAADYYSTQTMADISLMSPEEAVDILLSPPSLLQQILSALKWGALVAVVAQTGDFFESWMKRRAGVKDSSNMIPGHGGFFDRVDGLIAVCFVLGLLMHFGAMY